jgi:perosamine synthetase
MWKIPVASTDVSGNEEQYVVEAVRSSWVSSTGKFVDQFERQFSELCGVESTLACANGTVALHLALLGMGLRPGDEVIVPSLTYVATANAVRYCGAEPVFVDVDPQTWCLDPQQIEQAVSERTRGVIAVHLMGHPADMDGINEVAAIHGLWVIEDAAEAHFALYKNRPVGSLASLATFSFFGNKLITCGEGGAVTLNDPRLATRLKMLRGQGMDPRRRYYFPIIGHNYRLTNVACAMLCAQLERRDAIFETRRRVFARYDERLANVAGVHLQPIAPWATTSPWMYGCVIDPDEAGVTRDEVIAGLAEQKIDSRPFFIPVHTLPPYRRAGEAYRGPMPQTDYLAQNGIMLPTYNALRESEVDEVVDCISKMCTRARRTIATPIRRVA